MKKRTENQAEEREEEYEEDQRDTQRRERAGCLWRIFGIPNSSLVLLILLGTILAVVVFVSVDKVGGFFGDVFDLLDPGVKTYNVESTAIILERVQNLSQLTTVRHNLVRTISVDGDTALGFFFGDSATMIVAGEVEAGIDLGQLTEASITLIDGVLTITLPTPQVLDCSLDEQNTRVVSRETGLLVDGDPGLEAEIRRTLGTREFGYMALQEGILYDANEQAKILIENFVNALPLDESITAVQVVPTEPPVESILPDTC